MMLPTNPKLTKLRMIADRKKATWEAVSRAERELSQDWLDSRYEYQEAIREIGYCPGCEELLNECSCVVMAK